MTFTHMGKALNSAVVRRQYRVVLDKVQVQSGEINSRRRSILVTVMKKRRVFRGGTSIDDDDKERREYYTNLITECKEELEEEPQTTKTRTRKKSSTKKTRKKSVAKRIDLLGRRVVIMSADVFGGKEYQYYNGVVVRKCKYRQNGKTKNGYAVKWHIGDEDFWSVWMSIYTRIWIWMSIGCVCLGT